MTGTGFLLDTNVVSELRKRDRADPNVVAWFDSNHESDFWLSVLVVGELRRGVELLRRRDQESATAFGTWLDSVVEDFADQILPVSAKIAERWVSSESPILYRS